MSALIKTAQPFLVRPPIGARIADSFNDTDVVELPGVLITCEDGTTGWGYTMTLGDGGDAILSYLRLLATLLPGRSPFETRALAGELHWSAAHWTGRSGAAQMAQSAIDIALWDAKAKLAGQPLWRLLGGSESKALPCYNTHAGWLNISAGELVSNARQVRDAGLMGMKVKLGKPDWREDLERVAKVRAALGDGMRLMTDVNQRWDLNTAIAAGRRLPDYDVFWLEEPLDPDDVLAHAKLVTALRTPVALGEHVYTVRAFRDYVHQDAVRFVQPDVTRVGGVTAFLQVADLAAAYNLPVCAHAGDLMQVHQHLSFALPNVPFLEYLPWCTSIWQSPLELRDGLVVAPSEPGASTALTTEAFEAWRVA